MPAACSIGMRVRCRALRRISLERLSPWMYSVTSPIVPCSAIDDEVQRSHDVRVPYPRAEPRLMEQHGEDGRSQAALVIEQLDGHELPVPPARRSTTKVDPREAAASDTLVDRVGAELAGPAFRSLEQPAARRRDVHDAKIAAGYRLAAPGRAAPAWVARDAARASPADEGWSVARRSKTQCA